MVKHGQHLIRGVLLAKNFVQFQRNKKLVKDIIGFRIQ